LLRQRNDAGDDRHYLRDRCRYVSLAEVPMQITAESKVADIAAASPATIKVFQRHHIDFCCGGKMPLAEACSRHAVDPGALLAELRSAQSSAPDPTDWRVETLAALTAHIQERYHVPLRLELPRLAAMLAKVVDRHGERLPEALPLRQTFEDLSSELIEHMAREDAVLFPLIVELEAGNEPDAGPASTAWIRQIVEKMVAEHDAAGAALRAMREMTGDYTPPEWACPTLLGLYHGLAELEREMQVHVHLENAILFPRASER
jgi:regulator of cell morphogenesis and NO signaling